ncbi:MAG: Na/Pi cotransporter family protein [Lachnospiraceae bacterium]|nr:Na/Pi cotransporter family protein [Lachnospiraceae bacterium]
MDFDFFDLLSMIGGLALFLYGMNVLGDGLSRLSGSKMERLLEKLTSKKIMAVLLGAAVTAVIQSSSATTVMVVGFVNSGIMKLSQSIGIIMGANIGTTVTSWILSLAGIEGSNFFVRLLKPSSFSPIIAIVGVAFMLFSKNNRRREIGTIFAGFAILMFGMETMSGAVKGLAEVEGFTSILTRFSNPILGVLAGALLTAVIQSSSASVGILQALCLSGVITYGSAIPIIMGQNIGTCITAVMSGIGAEKNAKRASLVHLYFNLIGTILFMTVFYSVNVFADFAFLNDFAGPVGIAVIHSLFNIGATIVLYPFSDVIEKLAVLSVRDKDGQDKDTVEKNAELARLDDRFLGNPSFAVEVCSSVAQKMAGRVLESVRLSGQIVRGYDKKIYADIISIEEEIDRYEDALGTYLVKLSAKNLSSQDSTTLSIILHTLSDFERISDHAADIAHAVKKMKSKDLHFTKKMVSELEIFSDSVYDIVDMSVRIFETGDTYAAKDVEPLGQVIDNINKEVKKRQIKRLRKGKNTIESGFVMTDISTAYERIADHCSNIAVCVMQVNENGFETHEYLGKMKTGDNPEYARAYNIYLDKYSLDR